MALGDNDVRRAFLNGETVFREDVLADGTPSYTACKIVTVDMIAPNGGVDGVETVSFVPNASVVEVKRTGNTAIFSTLYSKYEMISKWRLQSLLT